jgi:hypothetical protein
VAPYPSNVDALPLKSKKLWESTLVSSCSSLSFTSILYRSFITCVMYLVSCLYLVIYVNSHSFISREVTFYVKVEIK